MLGFQDSSKSLYAVSLDPQTGKSKLGWSLLNCQCQIMQDNGGDPVLKIFSNTTREEKVLSLSQKKLKVYGGTSLYSFVFLSRHLQAYIKFQPLATNPDFGNDSLEQQLKDLQNLNTKELPVYQGSKKIAKKEISEDSNPFLQPLVKVQVSAPASAAKSSPSTPLEMPKTYVTAKIRPVKKFNFVFPGNSPTATNKENVITSVYGSGRSAAAHYSLLSVGSQVRSVANGYNQKSRFKPYSLKETSSRDSEGFSNLGQTCYVAAILQLLFHSVTLRNRILSERKAVREVLGKASVFEAFADLFQRKLDKEFVTLKQVQSKVAGFTNKFAQFEQEDAHEFMMACFEQLSFENLSTRATDENQPVVVNVDTGKELSLLKRDPIQNTLQFKIKHVLSCSICPRLSYHSEVFRDLSLPLPQDCDNLSIEKLMDAYFEADSVEYSCEGDSCTSKEALIGHGLDPENIPSTLFLHLVPFEMVGEGSAFKRIDPIHIPLNLDLSRYFLQSSSANSSEARPVPSRYRLAGIVSHLGNTMRSGHYVFAKRNLSTGLWTEYNDSVVKRDLAHGLERRVASQAYILSYELDV